MLVTSASRRPLYCLKSAIEWTAGAVLSDIGDGRESAADAGVGAVDIGEVLRAQAGGERRTNVDAPSRDVRAIYAGESPAVAQSAVGITVPRTPAPGKFRNVEAMLPEGANAASAEVGYHPVPVAVVFWFCPS